MHLSSIIAFARFWSSAPLIRVTRRSSLGESVGVEVDVVVDEGRDEKERVVVAYARTHVIQ